MRLNRYLAECGVASRRKSDELILSGEVRVNDKIALVGAQVNPQTDKVFVRGNLVQIDNKVYYAFYKPKNVLTTLADPFNRKTILDFTFKIKERIFPVGRLDYDSEGLLILTNDGGLAHQIQHPKYKVDKIYEVEVCSELNPEQEFFFLNGIPFEEGLAKCVSIKKIKPRIYQLILQQGWNRQIRRMFQYFDIQVIRLLRKKVGGVGLNGLQEGVLKKISKQKIIKNYRK